MPSERYYELFIRSHAPDVVLVHAAHRLRFVPDGLREKCTPPRHSGGLLPFSWDNLTNRGLVRIAPDRVLVWNEHQMREAVIYHDIPSNRVVVTGAPRFDDFFAMRPSTTRAEFCTRAGLDPSQRFLLYLCSSHFVAPDEVGFVRRWAQAVRRDPSVGDCGILVRPHPANTEAWDGVDLRDIEKAAVWNEPLRQADPALYDSLYHCAGTVGLNTSAMIEAGILGKPVFTIQTTEFEGGKSRPCTFITCREMAGMLKLPGISSSTSISSAHRWRSQTQASSAAAGSSRHLFARAESTCRRSHHGRRD